MKRVLAFFVTFLLFATPVYAGVFGAIKNYATENLVLFGVEIIFAIVATFWAGAKLYKKAFKETLDVPFAIKKALNEKSPGGKDIVESERTEIAKEVGEAAQSIGEVIAARKKNK